jgi:hypothetical protein
MGDLDGFFLGEGSSELGSFISVRRSHAEVTMQNVSWHVTQLETFHRVEVKVCAFDASLCELERRCKLK